MKLRGLPLSAVTGSLHYLPSQDVCVQQSHATKRLLPWHGRLKDFFQGGTLEDFSKIFLGAGSKVAKFVLSYSKLRKQPFLLQFSKSRRPRPRRLCTLKWNFEDLLPCYCHTIKTNSTTVRTQVWQPTFAGKGADTNSSLNHTRTANLTRMQCECHTGKNLSLYDLNQSIGIKMLRSVFLQIFSS